MPSHYIESSRRKAPDHDHSRRLRRVGDVPAWVYVASLQRFWLDQITDWALVKPVRGLAHDLSYFDDHIVDRIMGAPAPAIRTISSLAQLEEQMVGAQLDNDSDNFAQGSGLAGKLPNGWRPSCTGSRTALYCAASAKIQSITVESLGISPTSLNNPCSDPAIWCCLCL